MCLWWWKRRRNLGKIIRVDEIRGCWDALVCLGSRCLCLLTCSVVVEFCLEIERLRWELGMWKTVSELYIDNREGIGWQQGWVTWCESRVTIHWHHRRIDSLAFGCLEIKSIAISHVKTCSFHGGLDPSRWPAWLAGAVLVVLCF